MQHLTLWSSLFRGRDRPQTNKQMSTFQWLNTPHKTRTRKRKKCCLGGQGRPLLEGSSQQRTEWDRERIVGRWGKMGANTFLLHIKLVDYLAFVLVPLLLSPLHLHSIAVPAPFVLLSAWPEVSPWSSSSWPSSN